MTDYFTIKIPEGEGERHNERRQDLGLSWAAYIDGEAPEEPAWIDGLRADLSNSGEGSDAIAYEDLVSACRTAIREELPDRLF